MNPIVEVNVQSEIGKLNGVIIHTPGEEVENMTPENAERALYSDIINLSIARKEYKQISGVLSKLTKTYEVKDLLCNILKDDKIKQEVLDRIERIAVKMKDGSELVMRENGAGDGVGIDQTLYALGFGPDAGFTSDTVVYVLAQTFDLADVQSVVINDTEYPLAA